ncbi:MAG: GumC family protein [Deltaproteobacteria bacterium]
MSMNTTAVDTIDVADLARTVRRGWRAVAAFTALGAVAALAVVLWAPPKYSASATVIMKISSDPGTSLLSKLAGEAGDAAGSMLSSATKSPTETEIQILSSRAVGGRVVDSLRLQARVTTPRGIPPARLIDSLSLGGSFRSRKYHFAKQGAAYRFEGPADAGVATPGLPAKLAVGSITLDTKDLPDAFDVVLRDREDAITRFEKYLSVEKAGGEVVRVTYRGDDSLTAAAAANALIADYLARRTTTDRGVNQHRVEFLTAKADSASAELATASRELRRQQERSGVIDPTVVGKIELEAASQIRTSLAELEMEEGAIKQLIAKATNGSIQPRELAAYPTFLKSPAINQLIGELVRVETDRYKALESRTEKDPEVIALTQSAKNIEGQLLPLAKSYSTSITQQRGDAQLRFDSLQTQIAALPAVAESGLRLQRDVLRLNQVYAALGAQLVEARLAAISEGGDVHVLDTAVSPKEPSFPRPIMTMGVGIGAGVLAGMIAALMIGALGRWVQDPREVERTTGVPALRFDPTVPLLMNGATSRTVLVVPLDQRAQMDPVIQRLAQTAESRSIRATVLDLSDYQSATTALVPRITAGTIESVGTFDVNGTISRLENEFGMVIVRLPGLVTDAAAAALTGSRPVLLVAPQRRIDREKLVGAVQLLRRLDVPCAGIVLSGSEQNGILTS